MKKSNLFTLFLATLLVNTFSSYACENTPPNSPASRKKTSPNRFEIQQGNMARMFFLAVIASSVTPEPLTEQDVNSPKVSRKSPTKQKQKKK